MFSPRNVEFICASCFLCLAMVRNMWIKYTNLQIMKIPDFQATPYQGPYLNDDDIANYEQEWVQYLGIAPHIKVTQKDYLIKERLRENKFKKCFETCFV
jgi:hypothetical protein